MAREAVWTARTRGAADADAEDIAQEALTRFVVARAKVNKPKAWIRRVVRNLLYDQQKRRNTRERVHSEAQQQARAPESPSGEWQAVVEVERILPSLSDRSRKLLDLYRRGYTRGEIAAYLGCESHQVGPRIRRALATARRVAARKRSR